MIGLLIGGEYALFGMLLVSIVFSLSLHEYGHALAATHFGDDTARQLGRLTLNPVSHIDPLGLLMVVFIGFGYARPVPFRTDRLNSFWAPMLIAVAGPLANLLIALVVMNLLQAGINGNWAWLMQEHVLQGLQMLAYLNVILMLFNLLPIGPLDGHFILPYFLPRSLSRLYREYNARFGAIAFLGLVLLSIVGLPVFRFLSSAALAVLPMLNLLD